MNPEGSSISPEEQNALDSGKKRREELGIPELPGKFGIMQKATNLAFEAENEAIRKAEAEGAELTEEELEEIGGKAFRAALDKL